MSRYMAGLRFGMLEVLGRSDSINKRGIVWRCRCDCGTTKDIVGADMRAGHARSCGCFRRSVLASSGYKHGGCGTPEWNVWTDMLRRCEDPRVISYENYGGRGIQVCERWHSFDNFRADMGLRAPGMTLERNEVNGNYEPENCEWIPAAHQANNTRRSVRVVVDGDTVCLMVACARLGVPYSRTRDRMKKLNWSFERAVAEPKKINGTMYA